MNMRRSLIVTTFFLLTAAYVTLALFLAMKNDDYHVIGLIGGINGLLRNPMGHGLGVGGNFGNALVTVNWSDFQKNGADFGLESAVGVIFYQMGVGGLGLFALYATLIKRAYALALPVRQEATIVAAVVFVFANAIFQEEAFAPAL